MFRRWPFFQRLLSWTKPYAPVDHNDPAYERYDWNSLLANEPENQAIMPGLMDGASYFPSRPEMQRNLEQFAAQTGIRIRHNTRWTGTRRETTSDGTQEFVIETTDGEYRTPIAIFAVGVAEPSVPETPGIELATHYAGTRPAESYADRRVFIIGKQNSGFELASGLLQWACEIILASPSPAKLSVNTKSLVGVRARYVQPVEDHVLGGGVTILDAKIGRIGRLQGADGFEVVVQPTGGGNEIRFEVDEVIAATGFVAPLQDLPSLGVTTFGLSRLPAVTPYWESATVPNLFFAGTLSQAAGGLKKHGLPANSGAVHGARYNARVLTRRIAATRFGSEAAQTKPAIPANGLVDWMARAVMSGPALFHQRAYLARVASLDASAGPRDEGIVPLAAFVDGTGSDGTGDAVAVTLEADGSGAIYPVVYARWGGRLDEVTLDPDPLLRYDTPAVRSRLEELLRPR
jgi:thioredoxin reductase